jgi:hypothetical protein
MTSRFTLASRFIANNPQTPDGRPRKVYGVVKIPIETIRSESILLEGRDRTPLRALCVYATGEADRPSHADILLNGLSRHDLSRSKQNRVAENLSKKIARNILTVQEFTEVADLRPWS